MPSVKVACLALASLLAVALAVVHFGAPSESGLAVGSPQLPGRAQSRFLQELGETYAPTSEAGAAPGAEGGDADLIPLVEAGNRDGIQSLLDSGADINVNRDTFNTPVS
jgi:hypothetical protein